MNGRFIHSLQLISALEKKHQDIHCNNLTHITTLSNLIYLSGNSQILSNEAYLARGLIGFPSGDTTSLYMDAIFSAFNCPTDPLVNELALILIYLSHCLRQLLTNSWYVPS